MTTMTRLRILVAGDPYIPAAQFARGLEGLEREHDITYVDVDMARPFAPTSPSEQRIREYAGSPDELVELLDDHEVLVVHGAAVTDRVLEAAPLRLVCCARGGTRQCRRRRGGGARVTITTTPGKNARAVVELTLGFLIMLARGVRLVTAHAAERDAARGERIRGRGVLRRGAARPDDRACRLRQRRPGRGQGGRQRSACVSWPTTPGCRSEAFGDVEAVTLDDLLARSEFVSLHARVTPENENLMNAELVRAHAAAARSSSIPRARRWWTSRHCSTRSAAGTSPAPPSTSCGPRRSRAAIRCSTSRASSITPHIGGATDETIERGVAMVAEEITHLAAGLAPVHAR